MKSGVSCARNATIASFASKELPYRGLGTGVKRAIEVIPDIQFESDRDANWLKAVVRRTGKFETTDHAEKTVIGEDNAAFGGEKADIDKEKSAIRDSESFESRINDRHLTKPTATAIRKLRDSLGTTGLVSRSIVMQIVDLEKTRATD